jgi:hypothetical protein
MKKVIPTLQLILLFSLSSTAQQPGYDKLALDLFHSFKYNDTATFMRCFISNKDANQLMYQYIRLNNIKDTGAFANIEMPDLHSLLKREYIYARKMYSDSGVAWGNTQFVNSYYNILKDKNSLYPSALGEILFTSGNRYFSLVLTAAVYMNGSWRLVSFRPATGVPAQPQRVSYFAEQDELFLLHGLTPPSKNKMEKAVPPKAKTAPPKKTTPVKPSL